MSFVQLDGTHTPAKRVGEAVAYQGIKKYKTNNMLILCDSKSITITCNDPISGNHKDALNNTQNFDIMVTSLKEFNISVSGLFLNAVTGFDTVQFGNCLF